MSNLPRRNSIRELARKIAGGGSHNIPDKQAAPAIKEGVPTIADSLRNVEWEDIPSGTEFAATPAGVFNESGSAGNLRRTRDDIPFGMVWCGICDCACDFEEFGLHNLTGKLDSDGYHRGYIGIGATCHGRTTVITVSFQMLRQNRGRRILAWKRQPAIKVSNSGANERREPIPGLLTPPVRLLLRDKGQNYWTAPVFDRREFDRRTREIIERYEKRIEDTH